MSLTLLARDILYPLLPEVVIISGMPTWGEGLKYDPYLFALSTTILLIGSYFVVCFSRLAHKAAHSGVVPSLIIGPLAFASGLTALGFIDRLSQQSLEPQAHGSIWIFLSFTCLATIAFATFKKIHSSQNLNFIHLVWCSALLGLGLLLTSIVGIFTFIHQAEIHVSLQALTFNFIFMTAISGIYLTLIHAYGSWPSTPPKIFKITTIAVIALSFKANQFLFDHSFSIRTMSTASASEMGYMDAVLSMGLLTIPVFLIASFLIFEAQEQAKPTQYKNKYAAFFFQNKIISLTAFIGVSISIYIFFFTLSAHERYHMLEVQKAHQNLELQLEKEIERALSFLSSTEAIYNTQQNVTQEEFVAFMAYTIFNKEPSTRGIMFYTPKAEHPQTIRSTFPEDYWPYYESVFKENPEAQQLLKDILSDGTEKIAYINPKGAPNTFFSKNMVIGFPVYKSREIKTQLTKDKIRANSADYIEGILILVFDAQRFYREVIDEVLPSEYMVQVRAEHHGDIIYTNNAGFLPEFNQTVYSTERFIIEIGTSLSYRYKAIFLGLFYAIVCLSITFFVASYFYTLMLGRKRLLTSQEAQRQYLKEVKIERERAEEANKAKDMFLANMSHEIRTPMNSIIGMAHILEQSELTDDQRGWAKIISNSSQNLLQIINDILDLSKIEAGKMDIAPKATDLSVLIDDVCALFAYQCEQKGIELAVYFAPDFPLSAHIDPVRLRQILVNLIGNAVKFTKSGYIELSCSTSKHASEATRLNFQVNDSGIGIHPDKINYIFEKFSQESEETTRSYGGTGLGLYITHKLVTLMGGNIQVASEPNVGTTFAFYILAKQAQDTPQKNKLHVVVYTNKLQQKSLQEILVPHFDKITFVTTLKPPPAADFYFIDICFTRGRIVTFLKKYAANLAGKALIMLAGSTCSSEKTRPFKNTVGHIPKPLLPHNAKILAKLLKAKEKGQNPKLFINRQILVAAHEKQLSGIKTNDAIKPAYQNRKVLVVEDIKVNQLVMENILKPYGLEVEVAENGQVAIDKQKGNHYDLILMDCQMPVLDGYEATKRLREMGITTPIVALTADAMVGDRKRCLKAGMDDYLNKPVKPEEIEKVLRKYLNKKTK